MKILLSDPSFFPYSFGGGQVYVYRLAKELRQRAHDVTILSTRPWTNQTGEMVTSQYYYEGLPVIALSLNPHSITETDKYSEMSSLLIRGLHDILDKIKPDLVHMNGIKAALIMLCNDLKIPHVVTAHHPGFVCPAGTLLTPSEILCDQLASPSVCIPCCCELKLKKNVLGTILGNIPGLIYRPIGRMLSTRKKVPYLCRGIMFPWLIERKLETCSILLTKSQAIIAPSLSMKNILIRNGVPGNKIYHVPHGIVTVPRTTAEVIYGNTIKFGYMGSIGYPKGFHVLIKALELLSAKGKSELHIFGNAKNKWDRQYKDNCLVSYQGKPEIIDHGYIENDRLEDAYRDIHVLVVPSIYLEVFGLVILEALSAGRPVIVTKAGGPVELVRDGIDGFVVERNDPNALAEAMQKFIDDPDLIVRMSAQIAHVRTIQEHVDDIGRIYSALISGQAAFCT